MKMNKDAKLGIEQEKITKKDLRRANYRWLMSVCTFNYQTQQGASVAYSLSPILRKIYKNDDDYVEALNNHFQYFNTQPWLASIVLGATVAMEEKEGLRAKQAIQDFKVGVMGPLAGIGDSLLMVMIPTIMGSIAAYMAKEGNPIGVMLWMILIFIIFALRMRGFEFGYKQGVKIITEYGEKLNNLTEAASVLGLTVVGALIPSVISVVVPIKFTFGEVVMEIQPFLDQIMPSLVPVILTFVAYRLLGYKGMSVTKIILLVILFAMVAAAFGFLA